MKKFIVAILALVMLLSVTAIASAAESTFAIYGVPCQALADDELYQHHGEDYIVKGNDTDRQVQIKHRVTQSSADMNNRIAVYCKETRKTMAAGWKPANGSYYPHSSNAIRSNKSYTGAGRGNTDYVTDYDLTSITITGSIKGN